jgi:hypothetical protein
MSRMSKVVLAALILTTLSCSKNEEPNDLAKAQACLDAVPGNDPGKASDCFTYVEKYSSQQASILKCAILMTSGGLIEKKVVNAYNALKDDSQTNKAASFMAVLSLDVPDVNTAYGTAKKADVYCQESGVPGLRYISGLIVAGTAMAQMIGTPIDTTNPAAINTAITNLVNHCGGATTLPADCQANIATIGASATVLAGTYCATPEADNSVCSQVNAAVASAGGSDAVVGQALFCYLNHLTYNATTQKCQ